MFSQACAKNSVHGGACMVKGGMHGEGGGHAWQGGMSGRGCVHGRVGVHAGQMATEAGSPHPTGMPSCVAIVTFYFAFAKTDLRIAQFYLSRKLDHLARIHFKPVVILSLILHLLPCVTRLYL